MITSSLRLLPHAIILSCRSAGAMGRPVLMFLHGFPEAAFVWDRLLAHFARPENGGYRCIGPNLRGFEHFSAPPNVAAYKAKHLTQDIAALIALEVGQLDCLIAYNWGGAIAWSLAMARPELVRKLVIINSPHPGIFLRELQHSPAQQAARPQPTQIATIKIATNYRIYSTYRLNSLKCRLTRAATPCRRLNTAKPRLRAAS